MTERFRRATTASLLAALALGLTGCGGGALKAVWHKADKACLAGTRDEPGSDSCAQAGRGYVKYQHDTKLAADRYMRGCHPPNGSLSCMNATELARNVQTPPSMALPMAEELCNGRHYLSACTLLSDAYDKGLMGVTPDPARARELRWKTCFLGRGDTESMLSENLLGAALACDVLAIELGFDQDPDKRLTAARLKVLAKDLDLEALENSWREIDEHHLRVNRMIAANEKAAAQAQEDAERQQDMYQQMYDTLKGGGAGGGTSASFGKGGSSMGGLGPHPRHPGGGGGGGESRPPPKRTALPRGSTVATLDLGGSTNLQKQQQLEQRQEQQQQQATNDKAQAATALQQCLAQPITQTRPPPETNPFGGYAQMYRSLLAAAQDCSNKAGTDIKKFHACMGTSQADMARWPDEDRVQADHAAMMHRYSESASYFTGKMCPDGSVKKTQWNCMNSAPWVCTSYLQGAAEQMECDDGMVPSVREASYKHQDDDAKQQQNADCAKRYPQ